MAAKLAKAEGDFNALLDRPDRRRAGDEMAANGRRRPGTVPAEANGPSRDLRVYENVFAVVQMGNKSGQVQIGTLIQVGDVWRLIEAPSIAEGQAEASSSSFFFQPATAGRPLPRRRGSTRTRRGCWPSWRNSINSTRGAPTCSNRSRSWRRRRKSEPYGIARSADTISAAVQSGKSPDGDKRLESLFHRLGKSDKDAALAAYVRFRQLNAQYALSLQAPKADFNKIQSEWLKTLEQYIADYPASPDAAEAMLQLGIAREFAGQEEDAKRWYGRVAKDFAECPAAKKAAGAITRLDSVGKTIELSGKGVEGGEIDLAKYRGKVVLIQYWATWCGPSKADMAVLKELSAKYDSSFTVLGVSLDANAKDLNRFLAENRLPWPQIFEEGGLDSRPANLLGILTLPTMILVDQQGRVVNRNIQTADIEGELKKLIR